jgi:cation transporter-like permease
VNFLSRLVIGFCVMAAILLGGHWVGVHLPGGPPRHEGIEDWLLFAIFGIMASIIGTLVAFGLVAGAYSIGDLFIPHKKKETPDGPEAYPQT